MDRLLEIVKRRMRTFLIPFLIVFIVPVLYTALFARSYEADSLVWFDTDVSIVPVLSQQAASGDAGRPIQAQADTLQQLLQSRAFVSKVVEKTPLASKMTSDKQREDTIAFVQKNIRVDVVGPNSLRIAFFGQNSGQAVAVVRSATNGFLDWVRRAVKKQNADSIAFFTKNTSTYLKELDAARAALQVFKEQHPEAQALDIQDKVLNAPKVTASPAVQAEFERLKAQQEYAQKLYDDSLSDLAKTRVLSAAKEEQFLNGLRVVDNPVSPTSFSAKRLLLAAFLAFAAAVAVGGLAVFIAETRDRTLRSGADVEEVLSLPVLAEIPRDVRAGGARD